MNLIGYARVGTDDQNPDAPEDALEAVGCVGVFIDRTSGKFARRLELDAAFDILCVDDVLVVTKLDRLGCSVRNLIDLSDAFQARDVGLRVLDQGIDTTTPVGRMFFTCSPRSPSSRPR
jgi:DNA invertase Pin-like site-specific DNA recombinase